MIMYFIISTSLILILTIAFYMLSKKEKWEKDSGMSFECGFTSYFYSRFSFSIHYFIIALLFLFLDLELCFAMPYFKELVADMKTFNNVIMFLTALLLGLAYELITHKVKWQF